MKGNKHPDFTLTYRKVTVMSVPAALKLLRKYQVTDDANDCPHCERHLKFALLHKGIRVLVEADGHHVIGFCCSDVEKLKREKKNE